MFTWTSSAEENFKLWISRVCIRAVILNGAVGFPVLYKESDIVLCSKSSHRDLRCFGEESDCYLTVHWRGHQFSAPKEKSYTQKKNKLMWTFYFQFIFGVCWGEYRQQKRENY